MDKDGLCTGLRLQSRNMIRAIRNKKINLIKLMRLKEDKHLKDFVMCMVTINQKTSSKISKFGTQIRESCLKTLITILLKTLRPKVTNFKFFEKFP